MNTNIIEGIFLLVLVLALYIVYFFRGDRKKLVDASKKSRKMFIQNSVRLFCNICDNCNS